MQVKVFDSSISILLEPRQIISLDRVVGINLEFPPTEDLRAGKQFEKHQLDTRINLFWKRITTLFSKLEYLIELNKCGLFNHQIIKLI
mgnify:CR=1 FL=1